MNMTLAELREDIRRRLGGSKLCVELEDSDLDAAISEATDEITRYFPGEAFSALPSASAEIKRYVIEQRLLVGITDVNFLDPNQTSDRITDNPFLNFQYLGAEGFVDAGIAEVNQQLSYLEDARRVLSSLPQWEAEWEFDSVTATKVYALYVDLPEGLTSYMVSYRYLFGYEASDKTDRGLRMIPDTYTMWIRNYARAAAREILGDIRNKFGGVPLPDGGNAEVDGSSQIERATADKEKLIEDISKRQRKLPVIVG